MQPVIASLHWVSTGRTVRTHCSMCGGPLQCMWRAADPDAGAVTPVQPYNPAGALLGRVLASSGGSQPPDGSKPSMFSVKRYAGYFNVDTQVLSGCYFLLHALSRLLLAACWGCLRHCILPWPWCSSLTVAQAAGIASWRGTEQHAFRERHQQWPLAWKASSPLATA